MALGNNAPGETEIAVIGGGLVGSAIAWGLARLGKQVTVLDEGDMAFRASRGNFALVWIQSKGLGMPEYAGWSKASAECWPDFAKALLEETELDVCYQQPGGFIMCLSEAEFETQRDRMMRLHNQPAMVQYPYEMLDYAETKRRLPALGPTVVGSSYCPLDGHVNSLRLFRALHRSFGQKGVDYRPEHDVESIAPSDTGFTIKGAWGELKASKVVLAAGLGNARLGSMVGLHVPVVPSKGQIIVTEKAAPFLHHPVVTTRQTDEGGVMIGDSQEDLGFNTVVTQPVISMMAERAIRTFPIIGGLNVVRTWSALRVMTQDGFPIYDQSTRFPGAFVATCHSGVTLAANHALKVAPMIAAGALASDDQFGAFSARRFHVPAAA